VKFGTTKNLGLNAYKPLKNNANEINKFKEVTAEQLPEKVKAKC
jgi:uncharacterized protein YxeA